MKDFICKRIGGLMAWVITFFILKYSIIFALYLSDIDSAQLLDLTPLRNINNV